MAPVPAACGGTRARLRRSHPGSFFWELFLCRDSRAPSPTKEYFVGNERFSRQNELVKVSTHGPCGGSLADTHGAGKHAWLHPKNPGQGRDELLKFSPVGWKQNFFVPKTTGQRSTFQQELLYPWNRYKSIGLYGWKHTQAYEKIRFTTPSTTQIFSPDSHFCLCGKALQGRYLLPSELTP